MNRLSQLHIPTLRNDPADAEAPSHRLLVRGGYVRQVGAGLFSFLPLGWRVHQKVVQIIREEMNAVGAQEMLAPLLAPAELWQESGRYEIPEVFRLTDRHGRDLILSMTHEETMTFHARELGSYRQLPQFWYHFQVKGRDEATPARRAAARARVRDEGRLLLRPRRGGAGRQLLEVRRRLPQDVRALRPALLRVRGRRGPDGRRGRARILGSLPGGRERDRALRKGRLRGQRRGCEERSLRARVPRAPRRAAARSRRPSIRTIEEVAEFLHVDPRATAKAMPVVGPDGKLVLGLIRGDHRLHELKLAAVLGGEFRPAHPEEIEQAFGASGGSLGPLGVKLRVIADESLREGQFVSGANRDGFHLLGVEAGRDYQPEFADIREVVDGDACIHCGGRITVEPAIEIGNIFKLGTRYSESLGANYLDENGKEQPIVMGSYGIGPGRVVAAAIEQNHDGNKIVWPRSLAPYDVEIVALQGAGESLLKTAEEIGAALSDAGCEVLLDDREARPGEKFADADLIGAPLRITVGKKTLEDGAVDLRLLASGEERRVPAAEAAAQAAELLA